MLFSTLKMIALINIIETVQYNNQNAVKMFDFYKAKYNKQYTDKVAEGIGLRNFIKNLNKVASLNENATDKFKLYQLNRYADIDAEDFENHYGVEISPYQNVLNTTSGKLPRIDKPDISPTGLYDLTKADQLYKHFLEKHKTKNYTKKRDRMMHYYKFVKTLVVINRAKMIGDTKPLDEYADVLDHPTDYFY